MQRDAAGRQAAASSASGAGRVVLLLEGPAAPFFAALAGALEARGAAVRRLLVCLGEAVFWAPRRGDWFTAAPDAWPTFLASYCGRHGVTDLVMLGDGRPRHRAAIALAARHGLAVHVVEQGYLRPDRLTVERFGMGGFSRFPRTPEAVRALARQVTPPQGGPSLATSFLRYTLSDLAFHLPNLVAGPLLHPHYRSHGAVPPLQEYAGWLGKFARAGRERRHAAAVLGDLATSAAPLFLMPLQLPGDYQIRLHAPGGDLLAVVDALVHHFRAHAPRAARLLFKVHPIDNGLVRWHRGIAAAAGPDAHRIAVIDGGDLAALLARADGVVTVNSTAGLAAIAAGRPLALLGRAVHDVPGVVDAAPLARFWHDPTPPDPALAADLLAALAGATQVRGAFLGAPGIAAGVEAMAARILDPADPLHGLGAGPSSSRALARAEELGLPATLAAAPASPEFTP